MNNQECDNQCICKMFKWINFYHQPNRQGNFKPANVGVNQEETKEDDDGENVENIQTVMELAKCNKKEAIKALTQCDGAPVQAIMLLLK